MANYHYIVLFVTLAFAFVLPSILAVSPKEETVIADVEDHARERATSDQGYNAEQFSEKFAGDVEASITKKNLTRRELTQCDTKNPIDKCWRCKADWADNRKALADCAIGFGKGTTGGAGGEIYTVTSNEDDDPVNAKEGTLRFGMNQKKPLWIIFEKDMVITLKHTLVVTSDKTIDGRGAKVEIANGGGLTAHTVSNVILHGIHIHDIGTTPGFAGRAGCDGDAITVKSSSKIWIDHCTLSGGPDGLIDITVGSTGITISNCRFRDHDKVILLGADDSHPEDSAMQATVAYNWFEETCTQRMPRCRFGFFHVVNNNYIKWKLYAIGGSAGPTILSQGNRFQAADDKNLKKVTQRSDATEDVWKNWNWRSDSNDVFENGAFFEASGTDPQLSADQQAGMIPVEPGSKVPELTADAGMLSCVVGQPC